MALGGEHARHELDRTAPPRRVQDYWWSVWALRVMLYAWDDAAEPAVTDAFGHDAWRVREMAAKVVAGREVGMAAEAVATACADQTPRVRAAALRALGVIGEREHLDVIRGTLDDPDTEVRKRAEQALDTLARRLDLA